MNVFILNSGRCGSMTFANACKHITNYTSAHESRLTMINDERINYPNNHIESDCRLVYFLGRLDKKYGKNAFYVHLKRNIEDCTKSWLRRIHAPSCIICGHELNILGHSEFNNKNFTNAELIVKDYLQTCEENIELFLKDKPNQMIFRLEKAKFHFSVFYESIGAIGNLENAMSEWNNKYNASIIKN